MQTAVSVNGVPIRLTFERWYHIIENHDEMASHFYDVLETVETPAFVFRGNKGTMKAVKNFGREKWLTVIYRETSKQDGFVVTAYFLDTIAKGEKLWPQR